MLATFCRSHFPHPGTYLGGMAGLSTFVPCIKEQLGGRTRWPPLLGAPWSVQFAYKLSSCRSTTAGTRCDVPGREIGVRNEWSQIRGRYARIVCPHCVGCTLPLRRQWHEVRR